MPCVLQTGSTSAQCRNWWWSSQTLKVERSLKDGSLILSVTRLQKRTGKCEFSYSYFCCYMSSNCVFLKILACEGLLSLLVV